ncbi:helix-turn-helix domain-containing protein [Aneurinibacillus aneurinilyticus]|jgi:transposase|uniref:Helix-turn-helix domain-containing protein n=2 Tax=Aneurinibacillus aneurinilyticus TaxID=1391 RepID=A0A848CZB5_ANEAE|nr:helix-turn-helix domain-containing protein [Aneurinibacillus aneurinilyticus]ERI09809.1 hypothetical protein HMPREF0083_02072 [Aneurinibacillus aneurinilyticus ATCC 12856]MCI1696941.1 helix-turn-helix domain containing protein [Aneurinibacillus aneurinilyticus]MED0668787.1 helix-turn-helix domain-containing protein [Aneurinibacillus aneurinilyticus]MED0708032.1 helix-turn-helix domain-containing protein [Aneurinibacillus aneurinilyticus]MED0722195.1 helix-turn-helix domain-containing protei
MRTLKKSYSLLFKFQVIMDAMIYENNARAARKHQLNITIVSRWVREYKQGKFDSYFNG